ncbi:MAG: prepilin-type N-terminal cleavage/methylation domain-containing protein [Planctomycetaceae bacterium]|jgi:type II secretion system protein I|nr:prepilin-type N-terminal cleavage/methylation domain-containing protein [Planctomycetaceae bacterium]
MNKHGLTLIEVVTAMLLLGTLLVSLLVAFSRHAVQMARSSERLRVMQTAESQLADWHLQFGFAPVNEEGEWTIDGKTYHWRTEPIEQMIDRKMMLGKISFEVFETDSKTPILSLQLIVPSWESFD